VTRFAAVEHDVERYYTQRFVQHGPTARGVDWNSAESQALRFEQLMRVHEGSEPFAINDYGCGYGALLSFLAERGYAFSYQGFDLSEPMIDYAQANTTDRRATFFADEALLVEADYTVASGLFNVKLEADTTTWAAYVFDTLQRFSRLSRRGFAFNMLTSYSEHEKMRDDLFYADPREYFDICKREFSPNVALLHDYRLWEWTILVRLCD
jgi:SAM-dependent methyltransferase